MSKYKDTWDTFREHQKQLKKLGTILDNNKTKKTRKEINDTSFLKHKLLKPKKLNKELIKTDRFHRYALMVMINSHRADIVYSSNVYEEVYLEGIRLFDDEKNFFICEILHDGARDA